MQPGQEGWCVNLATDFWETTGRLLEAEPWSGSFGVGDLYLKGGNVDEAAVAYRYNASGPRERPPCIGTRS